MKKWLPAIAAALFAAWFLSGLQAPKPRDGFNIASFGRLPVLLDGRIQPFDSVARNTLLSISGRSTVRLTNAPPLSALEWMLDAMARPEKADRLRIFRIQHPDLEGLLGTDKIGLQVLFLQRSVQSARVPFQSGRKAAPGGGRERGRGQIAQPFPEGPDAPL